MPHHRSSWLILFTCALTSLAACGDASDDAAPQPAPVEDDNLPQTKEDAAVATQEGKADFSLDICAHRGWYGDGACDWFCPRHDSDCDIAPLGPEPAGDAARLPIVLAHGFDASPTNRWGFYQVADALRADGHAVFIAEVPPYAAPAERATFLADHVERALEETGATQVNLIAHSMGGLDARFLISSLGYGDRVATLTTISSPHRGSRVADVALKLLPGPADDVINALAAAWGRTYSDVSDDADVRAALTGISEAAAPDFNADNPDDPRVSYRSWAGVSSAFGIRNPADLSACQGKLLADPRGGADRMDPTLLPMAAIVAQGARLIPNDGMVAVSSAIWGDFQGCIPADHLGEVGQVKREGADPQTGFDHLRWYRNIAFDLARDGF